MKNQVGPPEGGGRRDPESFGNSGQDKAGSANRSSGGAEPGKNLEDVPSIKGSGGGDPRKKGPVSR